MKKLTLYVFILIFASMNIFGSCKEDKKKREKALLEHRLYFEKYEIYDKIDSSYSGISVYVGYENGHKYKYHLFTGKNKSNMDVEHLTSECKKCLAEKSIESKK